VTIGVPPLGGLGLWLLLFFPFCGFLYFAYGFVTSVHFVVRFFTNEQEEQEEHGRLTYCRPLMQAVLTCGDQQLTVSTYSISKRA
jgi:hypothetical protein